MANASSEFDTQVALNEVCTSSNPLNALEAYQKNQTLLKDWRIIYAAEEDTGAFKLRRHGFSDKGFVSTCFRGKSLWILDREAISTLSPVEFKMGYGTYVDSNAASFIQTLAYRENPSPYSILCGRSLKAAFDNGELTRLNPYLYLWEAQRSWSPETIASCRQTIAAIHGLSLDENPLDDSWGKRFQARHREQAEAFSDDLLKGFQLQLDDGLYEGIAQQLDMVESMILRTKIIEASSSKSAEYKMEELVRFMHEELSTFMLRELIVCADILCRSGRSALSKKLNSVLDKKNPLATIKNCAWDLYVPRAMDFMTNSTNFLPKIDFYLANLITFDTDVADILKLSELRAIAMHRESPVTYPFFNEKLSDWLTIRVGTKRMSSLTEIFQEYGFKHRAQLRSCEGVRNVLEEDRARLLSMQKSH